MPRKILIIDDEKEVVQMMSRKIQKAGYEVSLAYNGKEGLEKSAQEHPHLILTDVAMPVMDGLTFYNELRNRDDMRDIPVIVTTAHGSTEDTFRALGVNDFLVKPFDGEILLDKVNSFFLRKKAVKVLMATKMVFLLRNIINESIEMSERINLQISNNSKDIVQEVHTLNPDLIVLDVDMFIVPAADEIIRELRLIPQLKETTILLTRSMIGDLAALVGSRHADKSIEDCLNRGASHFIGSLNKAAFSTIIHDYCC